MGGGETGSDVPQKRLTPNNETEEEMEEERREDVPSDEIMMDKTGGQDVMEEQVMEEQEEHHEVVEEVHRWANGRPQLTIGPFGNSPDAQTWTRWEAETNQLTEPLSQESVEPSPLALFAKLKQEHDLAKAVKLDNAEVHEDLWDQAVCKGPPLDGEKKALATLQGYIMLGRYQLRMWLDARKYLQSSHGVDWVKQAGGGNVKALEDAEAVHDILWQLARNDWFKYPLGSRLISFGFSARYQTQAKRGIKVLYTRKGPSSRRQQPPLKPDEKANPKKKNHQVCWQEIPGPPSWLDRIHDQVFAVPKGVIDNVIQDWRIVFHAGANKLNDCVWAPSFCLPTINSLLWITDEKTLMRYQDLGEMFLLFQLHPNTAKFTAVNLGPLEFGAKECAHRWMCWSRHLMGFKYSPYNSIRMYLVLEKIIQGDRHDPNNAFQCYSILLNLPGTKGYKPLLAWISKHRKDGSLASDFVCFVDDLQITGQGRWQVREAGHAISSRQSYLGIQDALQKLRLADGTRRPRAWVGVNVCMEEERGVMVLTSQEKWDRMKAICEHWQKLLDQEKTSLDFKQLRSDHGFMVYMTQAYPGMKPYLKGFHLTLETWRGGRNSKGCKLPRNEIKEKAVQQKHPVLTTFTT
jgi:hypothetical protein